MATYEFGSLIRKLRIEKGLSQEELCEGICSQKTMSQVENGNHLPQGSRYDALMQRLGLSAAHYYHVFLGAKAYEAFEMQNKLKDLLSHKKYNQAEEVIGKLEKNKHFKSGSNLQFLLNSKAKVYTFKYQKYLEALEILNSAILVTKPKYNEEFVSKYMLSFDEIEVINRIASCYASLEHLEKAISLWYSLKESIESTYADEREKSKKYPDIIYNLTKCLGLSGRYDEAISLCIQARDMCVRNNRYFIYPRLLFNQLWCLNKRGDKEQAARSIPLAYYGFMMVEMYEEMEGTKKYAKEEFGIEL